MPWFQQKGNPKLVHAIRIFLFVVVIFIFHAHRQWNETHLDQSYSHYITFEDYQPFYPNAHDHYDPSQKKGVGPRKGVVQDEAGAELGRVVQTFPESLDIVGFSGPTNVLIAFDNDGRSLGMRILSSADTPDHVEEVVDDEYFMNLFVGKTREELAYDLPLDGVSGATLTSLAITKSVMNRLGSGYLPSGLFRLGPNIDSIRTVVPDCFVVIQSPGTFYYLYDCLDKRQNLIARVLCTSPAADGIRGYQGPTNALIVLDLDWRLIGVLINESFDNGPYVSYVKDDEYFRTLFNGLGLDDLAVMDLYQGEVEGVSGATMTSMAVAEGMVLAAKDFVHVQKLQAQESARPLLGKDDWGTIFVVALGCIIGFTRLRSKRIVRIAFPIILIGYLGLINGDLLSQAQLVGWVRYGIPWETAPGLIVLTAAALLIPITTKRNIYCSHLCPHGAAQQVLRKALPFHIKVPARLSRYLRMLPWILFLICLVLAMTVPTFSLVDLEPFDAWVIQVAGCATVIIAIVGLVASLFVPMAYCQYGCPTGALLRYLRLSPASDRWGARDWTVLALIGLGIALLV